MKNLNDAQKALLEYMEEVCNQEDDYYAACWETVKREVLDALSDVVITPKH